MSDGVPRDPLALVLDLPIEPKVRFYEFRKLIDWSKIPEEDPGRERLRALFYVGTQGLWPSKDEVWNWSALGEEWRPSSWDAAFVARVTDAAAHVPHPQLRAVLLDAAWKSANVEKKERRTVGHRLAQAHLTWARTLCAAEEFTSAWIHFSEARKLFTQLGYAAEGETVEREVTAHALRLLAAGHTSGVGAGDVLAAACGTSKGPVTGRAGVEPVLDGLLAFAAATPDYTWAINAIDTAEPMHGFVGRESRVLAELRVARAVREAEERAAKGDGALVEQVVLQKALQAVVENGLGRERIDELNERLREAGSRALGELKETRHEFDLSDGMKESLAKFLEAIREKARTDPKAALLFAAYQHTPALATVRKAHDDRGTSMLDLIHGVALVGDRIGGEITRDRQVKGDYVRTYQALQLRLLHTAIVAVEEVHADGLLVALLGCQAAEGRGDVAVREGLRAFAEERYAAAVYTLLPELEAWVRAIVRRSGRPRTAYRDGRQREHTLDTLVETLRSTFNEPDQKIADLLSTMLSDEDGFNLRNHALHGLIDPSHIGRGEALIVLHGLLLLAGVSVEEVEVPASGSGP